MPFIPVEQSGLTSEGVVKVPDAAPTQLGFAGVFLPTAVDADGQLVSAFPAALSPRVSLVAYAGNLGLNSGAVAVGLQLDTVRACTSWRSRRGRWPSASRSTLPDGAGKLTFTGYRQWISLAITYDPGQLPALISALVALAGLILSFMVRRRRVFVRAAAGPDGGTLVERRRPGPVGRGGRLRDRVRRAGRASCAPRRTAVDAGQRSVTAAEARGQPGSGQSSGRSGPGRA